jgi:hypothetical protein
MTLDLTDDEAAALARLLHDVIDGDRYPPSPHHGAEGDPRKAPARGTTRAVASAPEGQPTTASHQKTPRGQVRSPPTDPAPAPSPIRRHITYDGLQ